MSSASGSGGRKPSWSAAVVASALEATKKKKKPPKQVATEEASSSAADYDDDAGLVSLGWATIVSRGRRSRPVGAAVPPPTPVTGPGPSREETKTVKEEPKEAKVPEVGKESELKVAKVPEATKESEQVDLKMEPEEPKFLKPVTEERSKPSELNVKEQSKPEVEEQSKPDLEEQSKQSNPDMREQPKESIPEVKEQPERNLLELLPPSKLAFEEQFKSIKLALEEQPKPTMPMPVQEEEPRPSTSAEAFRTHAKEPRGAWGRPVSITKAITAPVLPPPPSLSGPRPDPPKPVIPTRVSSISRTCISQFPRPSTSSVGKATTAPAPEGFFGRRSGGGQRGGGRSRSDREKQRPVRPDPNLVENQKEIKDFVKSRPTAEGVLQSKKGTQGRVVELSTNYYPLEKMTNFNLFQYHVEFKPNEERTEVRKKMVKVHETNLGAFIFDGQSLYTPNRIRAKNLCSMNAYTQAKTMIELKLVSEIAPVDPIFLQVYNIMFRNIMLSMDLELMGRFYYDPAAKTEIPSRKLEMWPGYITSVRNHENQVMINIEVTHKVVRSDSVLDFINNVKRSTPSHYDYRKNVTKQLLGSVVVTSYLRKNYKIDDIKWEVMPKDEFQLRTGENKSYADYYKENYGLTVKDLTQPMLVSLPKKKDYHRGSSKPIYLVPEFCQMTGLSDQMRTDQALMKDLAKHLIMDPDERMKKANAFVQRWYNTPSVVKEFKIWNIQVGRKPQNCMGRVVDLDDLIVGPGQRGGGLGGGRDNGAVIKVKQDKPGEWGNIFKMRSMLSTVRMDRWVIIIPPNLDQLATQLVECLRSQGRAMSFAIDEPIRFKLRDTRPTSFAAAIQQIYTQLHGKVQMFFVLLPNFSQEIYSAVKKKTYCEIGVACQCAVAKTLQTKNMISVMNRIAIQMNAKLGGEPWTVEIPLRELMVVGYDVFHSPNKRNPSVGALVASTAHSCARFYSDTCFHKNRNELSANLCTAMSKALTAYKRVNGGRLPARIVLYRDGVGDGQLAYIYNTELAQIKEAIRTIYEADSYPMAKFSFIVVTKRIHTRIFQPNPTRPAQMLNPIPGTVVDDVITLPERYDFFMVTQAVNYHGTVSPTSYNVLSDEQGLDPDKMQRLTMKLCHLYFNYTGTIAVPAPCQFAHKLAYLTGMNLNCAAREELQNFLYFL